MAQNLPGRHRAPGRFNPLGELKVIAKESAQPAVKGAAIMAASGGLVVTAFASPANAAEMTVPSAQGVTSPIAGPSTGTVSVGSALGAIGFTATPAKPAAKAAAPLVIQDVVIEKQRQVAAQAKADAAKAKAAAAKAAAKAKADAAQAKARTERAAAATPRATTTTRAATTPTRSTTTSASRSTARAPIAAKKTNPAPPAPSASGLVGIAQRAFGVPYVYGGTSMGGFDCSGLTQWVYRQAGISIPRTASAQQSAARRVSSPQPGDLVFFGYPAYHVGIYASPGRLVDAQRTGTVVGNHSIWTTPSGYGRF